MKPKDHYETQAARALDLLERALDHLDTDHGGKHAAKLNTNAPLITALSQAGMAFMHAAEYALTEQVFGPPGSITVNGTPQQTVLFESQLDPDPNLQPFRQYPPNLQHTDEWGRPRCLKLITYADVQEVVQCALEATHDGDCDTLPSPPPQSYMAERPATGYPEARGWRSQE